MVEGVIMGGAPRLDTPGMAREGDWSSPVQVARFVSPAVIELRLCARPDPGSLGFASQARSMYANLGLGLITWGARPGDVVSEKVFLSDIGSQIDALQEIKRGFYLKDRGEDGPTPATTCVQQAPACPGRLCELQVLALLPVNGSPIASRALESLPPGATGRVADTRDLHHVFVANLTGAPAGSTTGFPREAATMFLRAEAALRREGLSFRDVVRTWIYIRDIDRDYSALNRARTAFFKSRGVRPPPASTGIQGSLHPQAHACGLDLYAIGGEGRPQIRPIHAPTMNEASSYGSDFSRGLRVSLPDRRVLYVSGTASIDGEGRVVHAGSIAGQTARMILNVEQLLASEGATPADIVSAITYLKRPEDLEPFLDACRRRGFPDLFPNTICIADVCRNEWLCELEAVAVLET